jgi:hypothetical protein
MPKTVEIEIGDHVLFKKDGRTFDFFAKRLTIPEFSNPQQVRDHRINLNCLGAMKTSLDVTATLELELKGWIAGLSNGQPA